jgi:hydrogenase-4 component B
VTSWLLGFAGLAVTASIGLAGRRWTRTWLVLTTAGAAAGLIAALMVLMGAADWEWRGAVPFGGEFLHLRLDALSAVFLVLICVVGTAGACYAREYWSDERYPASASRGRAWWSAILLCMGLVVTASNGLHFLIVWEAFAVCGYFLIVLERRQREVRAAGWLYLAASHAGTLVLFAFFALLAARTGSWQLGPLREHARLEPLFWLMLVGFGLKAGFFPLHVWLPSAHSNAPSHVSALMSGVAIKMGVYGIVRFGGWLPVPPAAGWVLMGVGALSALVGIAFAFVQTDVKRLLAYCSVENVGIILVGVGGALLAASRDEAGWGRLALAGALLHVWNHGAFKSLLFFGAGSILHSTGTRELSRLGGLWRSMPWTATMFVVGAVAVSGLPPLNGFVSEWLTYLWLFDVSSSAGGGPAAWWAALTVITLAAAGALTVASFVKAGTMIFPGNPRTQSAANAHESGSWMRVPMVAMAVVCVAIGLGPLVVFPAVGRAVTAWQPGWGITSPPGALGTLGRVHVLLSTLTALTIVMLFRRSHHNGIRRGLTWDCGYATPTARMQYTGASFSSTVAAWFGGVLRPEFSIRKPRGVLPVKAVRIINIPETVLERLVRPAGDLITQLSVSARRLQHGGLQLYVLYVLGGLIAIGALVAAGGRP